MIFIIYHCVDLISVLPLFSSVVQSDTVTTRIECQQISELNCPAPRRSTILMSGPCHLDRVAQERLPGAMGVAARMARCFCLTTSNKEISCLYESYATVTGGQA